jgi:type III restriction enzyme
MLKLKSYQEHVLDQLCDYFRSAVQLGDADLAFYQMVRRSYKPVEDLPGLPYVCLRLPTGGGKTFVACHSITIAAREYLRRDFPLVLWLVPTNAIREQTLKALRDRQHPYRQALDAAFGGRVAIMDLHEALNISRATLEGETCTIVSTLAASRVEEIDTRKIYEANGALMPHFLDLPHEVETVLEKSDGQVIYSLANLLCLYRPLVIVDEAHNARTPLSFQTLARLNPACIIEFTATPADDSNVLAHVSAAQLYAEGMIKLPIKLRAFANWQEALDEAIAQRGQLESLAREEMVASGELLRPILLLQAQPKSQRQETVTVEVLKQSLLNDFKIPEAQIAVATGEQQEIEGINLFDPACPIRFILTVRALAEGWDCSFAYVLCSVAELHSGTAVEQILGRVLRLPYARRKRQAELNQAYAFVTSQNFAQTAAELTDALIDNGFERYEARAAVQSHERRQLSFFQDPVLSRQNVPAESGVSFIIPRLAIRVDGQLELFETSYLPVQWELAKCEPGLTEIEFPDLYKVGEGAEIYLGDDERLRTRFIEALHAQLGFLDRSTGWTDSELALWLDRNIPHPDVPQSQSSLFLRKMVDIILMRGFSLEKLVHERFRLREAAQMKIAQYRDKARRDGFQRCLLPEMRPLLEVSPQYAFRYLPDQYPANWYYEGSYDFQKHYYRAVGELKSEGEEFTCAQFIDRLPQVKHWVRNLERRGFWFQTSTDKFYPDFVAELNDGRCLIVEYKGWDRYTTEDAKEKRVVGELWQALSKGQGIFLMPTRGDLTSIRQAAL